MSLVHSVVTVHDLGEQTLYVVLFSYHKILIFFYFLSFNELFSLGTAYFTWMHEYLYYLILSL